MDISSIENIFSLIDQDNDGFIHKFEFILFATMTTDNKHIEKFQKEILRLACT